MAAATPVYADVDTVARLADAVMWLRVHSARDDLAAAMEEEVRENPLRALTIHALIRMMRMDPATHRGSWPADPAGDAMRAVDVLAESHVGKFYPDLGPIARPGTKHAGRVLVRPAHMTPEVMTALGAMHSPALAGECGAPFALALTGAVSLESAAAASHLATHCAAAGGLGIAAAAAVGVSAVADAAASILTGGVPAEFAAADPVESYRTRDPEVYAALVAARGEAAAAWARGDSAAVAAALEKRYAAAPDFDVDPMLQLVMLLPLSAWIAAMTRPEHEGFRKRLADIKHRVAASNPVHWGSRGLSQKLAVENVDEEPALGAGSGECHLSGRCASSSSASEAELEAEAAAAIGRMNVR